MIKKILIICLSFMLIFGLTACGEDTESYGTIGTSLVLFKEIPNSALVYDMTTNIVYFSDKNSYGDSHCPYYAANGLPYRYNIELNTLEMIEVR